jgi:GNAT superfamily N-acetyltransferase
MPSVVHRKRLLTDPPQPTAVSGVRLRNYVDLADIAAWIELHRLAFADQTMGVRTWNDEDFRREFLDKPWWRADWMWFAELDGDRPMPIGTVTLALRQSATATRAVIHWLCVLPRFRRRGIGGLLIRTAERAAWDAGYREVALETHAAWREAAACYDALGYAVIWPAQGAEQSPRRSN